MRYSKQRELILNILRNRCDHPTADSIYTEARAIDSTISLGTVYRDLKVLEQTKQIHSIKTTDDKLHYDGDIRKHSHFVCTKCGNIFDIMAKPRIPSMLKGIGKVEESKCVYYGTCKGCQ